jgi:alpha-L-fucosidase
MNIEPELYYKMFQTKLGEVIDKYEPDLIWFDSKMDLIPDEYHRRFLAYYFNKAQALNKEVVVTTKKRQYPEEVAVFDYEKGHSEHLTLFPWLVDDTVGSGSWSYTETLKVKSADDVIDDFIDAVSKNGQLLLNISPKADGTIPQDQKNVLLAMGKWLKVNGEAIYETRPWLEYGEGPNRLDEEGIFVKSAKYVSKDIRYTRSKDNKTLYITLLDWPENLTFSPEILQINGQSNAKVEMLGHQGVLTYQVKDKKLTVTVPAKKPGNYAHSFKLTGFEFGLTPDAAAKRKTTIESFKLNPPDKHPRGDKDKKMKSRKKNVKKKVSNSVTY